MAYSKTTKDAMDKLSDAISDLDKCKSELVITQTAEQNSTIGKAIYSLSQTAKDLISLWDDLYKQNHQ